ncbi:MAG: RNA polymerase sigma factor [Treponema sp.]|nr:RNA polymerase sigma factor [Treponema sp.]
MTLGLSFFKNKTDADDFVQDVFIKVYTNLSTFRGESLFSTWLMRLAYNTAVNSVNRRKEYLSLSDEIEIFDNDFTPEENQMRKLTANAISETIKKLPKIYATCLDMYFFYDIKQTDISEILDIPLNTVKSYIFRAKKLLKEKLEESGVIGEEYE